MGGPPLGPGVNTRLRRGQSSRALLCSLIPYVLAQGPGGAQGTRGGCPPTQQAAGPRLTQSRAVSLAPSPGPPLPGSQGQGGSGPAHGRREAGVGRPAPFQVRGRGSRSSNLDPARWGHVQVSFLLPLRSLLPVPGGSEVDSHSHATVTRATLCGRPCLAPGRGSSPWALPVAPPRPPSHPGPRPRDPWKSFTQLSSLASYVRPGVSSSAGESGGSFHLWKTRLKAIYRAGPGRQDGGGWPQQCPARPNLHT